MGVPGRHQLQERTTSAGNTQSNMTVLVVRDGTPDANSHHVTTD
jgi:hypothetical protein